MSRHYMIVLVRKSITLFVALLLVLSFGVGVKFYLDCLASTSYFERRFRSPSL